MKNIRGIWLPDHEQHLLEFATHEGWSYQKHKLDAAVSLCPVKRTAVDIGGHCGLWAKHLTKLFDEVHSFEPVQAHRECYVKNVDGCFTLHPYALGDRDGSITIFTHPGSSGDSYVEGNGEIPMKTLDSFGIERVDFVKIDCEGFEKFVLLGGEHTIRRDHPVIIVEQKPGKAKKYGLEDTEAVDLLVSWGYKLRRVISGDYILS